MAGIRLLIAIDASPESIFPSVATPGGLTQCWASDVAEMRVLARQRHAVDLLECFTGHIQEVHPEFPLCGQ